MFREMRRKKQELTQEECLEILVKGTSGVLALSGNGGYPYAVPMSYVYHDAKIYFHAAKSGHKIDAVLNNDKASFCVIGRDRVIPEKFTTDYQSVIAFGRVRILEDDQEKRAAIGLLAVKYSPEQGESRDKEIEKDFPRLCMLEFSIEHMTGKKTLL